MVLECSAPLTPWQILNCMFELWISPQQQWWAASSTVDMFKVISI